MSQSFLHLLLFTTFLFLLIDGCKITVKIQSKTKNKFKIQVFVPGIKQKTERVTFTEPEEKKVQINGTNCLSKSWVIRTWKPDGAGDWVGAKQETAKIDGEGWFKINVGDDLRPMMNDRMGIFCSEGMFCAG